MKILEIILFMIFISYSQSIFGISNTSYCTTDIDSTVDYTTIKVNSAYIGGKVHVRWMTTDMKTWEHALKVGYTIERITVKENDQYLSEQDRLDSYVLLAHEYLPKSLADLEAATTNPNEGALANLLINEQSTQDSISLAAAGDNTLAKAVEQKAMRDNRYFFSHILAEKSFELACAMGMAYQDDSVEPNKQYSYIITLSQPLN